MPDLPASFAAVKELIASDRTHGATWLACRAVEGVALAVSAHGPEVDPLTVARQAAREIAVLRPSMVAIGNAAAELAVRLAAVPQPRAAAPGLATALVAEIEQTTDAIARTAAPLLHGVGLTHSFSGTVLAALRAARPEGVVVTEARPLCEGRVMATALAQVGLPSILITDAQAALHVPTVAFAVLGADAILPDGSFVNKVGSTLVALAAREAGRPVYVLCDLLKASAAPPRFEEDPPDQVWSTPPAGVLVRNIAFERVPAHLVTAYITPDGPIAPSNLTTPLSERVARWSWVR